MSRARARYRYLANLLFCHLAPALSPGTSSFGYRSNPLSPTRYFWKMPRGSSLYLNIYSGLLYTKTLLFFFLNLSSSVPAVYLNVELALEAKIDVVFLRWIVFIRRVKIKSTEKHRYKKKHLRKDRATPVPKNTRQWTTLLAQKKKKTTSLAIHTEC